MTIRSNIAITTTLIISALLFIISLHNRAIFIDDHWFAEQAYWLLHDGHVRSELFRGLLNFEVQDFTYHKLHIWQAAAIINYFGLSAYALKLVELLFFIVFLLALLIYFKNNYPRSDNLNLYFISLTLFVTNGLLVETVFNYRPESSLMLFGFLSFICLRYSLEKSKNFLFVIISAAFSGVAVLYHLNGIIFITTGFGLLVTEKRYKNAIIFIVTSILVSSCYFLDLNSTSDFSQFIYQLTNSAAIKKSSIGIWQYPANILLEIHNQFRHPKEGIFFLLMIILIISNWKNIRNNREIMLVFKYFVFAFIMLAVISPGKKDPNYYLLLYMPYVVIIASFCLFHISTQTKIIRNISYFLISLFLLTNYAYTLKLINTNKPNSASNRQMFTTLGINTDEIVAGPISLVFNEIENVKLHAVRTYFIKVEKGFTVLSNETFFSDMRKMNVSYIILSDGYSRELMLPDPTVVTNSHGYTYYRDYIDIDRKYYVFKSTL